MRYVNSMRTVRAFISTAACLVGIAMLLTLPAPLNHRFRSHYRTPQVRRTIERHTFVAQPETNAASHIGRAVIRADVVMPALRTQALRQRPVYTYFTSRKSLPCLFHRFKLGSSTTSSSDPFSLDFV